MPVPLLNTLSFILNCPLEKIAEKLSDPLTRNSVNNLLEDYTLRTKYPAAKDKQRIFRYGRLTLKPASELHAYGGYLGRCRICIFRPNQFLQVWLYNSTSTLATESDYNIHISTVYPIPHPKAIPATIP